MKILRNKFFLKGTVVIWFVTFLNVLFLPTVSWALTSGPAAPEFSSFEPVDTTDMVNLVTGDFTYNVPLVEIPGPEGGYPLSLAYHAGIMPGEESSWVGLGWNINPGSILRSVGGQPDELKQSTQVITDYWPGGDTRTYSIGVGYAGATVGLDLAFDTYRGFGAGVSVSYGYEFGGNGQAGLSVGISPYGDAAYMGIDVGLRASEDIGGGLTLKRSLGVGLMLVDSNDGFNVDGFAFTSVGLGDARKNGASLMDLNISTNGGMSMSSAVRVSNSGGPIGEISSSSWGIGLSVMIYGVTVSLGYGYNRYWMHNVSNADLYGSLYANSINSTLPANASFDCTGLMNDNTSNPINANPDVNMGGSLPTFDSYSVTAQGIGGGIQPYYYESGSMQRKGVSIDNAYKSFQNKIGFRFKNDFANSLIYNVEAVNPSNLNSFQNITSRIGRNGLDYTNSVFSSSNDDFNKTQGMLAGSRYIQWFTNWEIKNNKYMDANYQKYHPSFMPDLKNRDLLAGNYQLPLDNHIGGFIITNESGVSYHYSIPVYNFENTTKIYGQNNFTRTIDRKAPYAYTWLLTAITGSDFVDRGTIGEFDENDYGYWIKFDYGKWTNQYKWRTPETGTSRDLGAESSTCDYGKKELYYLNAIRTRSHTALFVKSIKEDGKSATEMSNGGFNVVRDGQNVVTDFPISTLKLDRILVMNNEVLTKRLIENYNGVATIPELIANGDLNLVYGGINFQNGDEILDNTDFDSRLKTDGYDLGNDALKQIVFAYDYSLCANTINSFSMDYTNFIKGSLNGKLTLKEVKIQGRNGVSVIPPTQFEYGSGLHNPAYSNNKDIWGYYMSDYPTIDQDKIEKITTPNSAFYTDAWSLVKIRTGLGAEVNINYESDKFERSFMDNYRNLAIKQINYLSGSNFQLTVFSAQPANTFAELTVGQKVSLKALLKTYSVSTFGQQQQITDGSQIFQDDNAEILGTGTNTISVYSPALLNFMSQYPVTNTCGGTYQINCNMLAGNLIFDRGTDNYGGGLRVREITLRSENIEQVTSYNYTGGITNLEPRSFNVQYNYSVFGGNSVLNQLPYENIFYLKSLKAIANQMFLYPPGVIYNRVTVREKIRDYSATPMKEQSVPGYTEYEFSSMDDAWITREERSLINDGANHTFAKHFKFKDFRARVGLLKSTTRYGTNGILSKVEQKYLHDPTEAGANFEAQLDTRFKNQGRVDQVYLEKRNANGETQLMITEVEEFPAVLVGTRSYDSKKGTTESRILGYDFYNSKPNLMLGSDDFGNQFWTRTVAAREKYPVMGTKIFNPLNKNMLSQEAANYTYKVVPNKANPIFKIDYDSVGLVGAQVTIWSNNLNVEGLGQGLTTQSDIWRKESSYVWIGNDAVVLNSNGTYPIANFVDFNFANPSLNTLWQSSGKVTKIDPWSHTLESEDINGVKASVLMNPKCFYITAHSVGAARNEMAYMSSEYFSEYPASGIREGNTEIGQGVIVNKPLWAHTGSYCLEVPTASDGFKFTFTPQQSKQVGVTPLQTRKYKASVWVYLPGMAEGYPNNIDDQALENVRIQFKRTTSNTIVAYKARKMAYKAGSHYLLEIDIDPGASLDPIQVICRNESAGRPVYFDDFRVHPIDAAFTSYVYDINSGKLTYILDQNNFFVHYFYNDKGQLVKTTKELLQYPDEMIMMEKYMHYKRDN